MLQGPARPQMGLHWEVISSRDLYILLHLLSHSPNGKCCQNKISNPVLYTSVILSEQLQSREVVDLQRAVNS